MYLEHLWGIFGENNSPFHVSFSMVWSGVSYIVMQVWILLVSHTLNAFSVLAFVSPIQIIEFGSHALSFVQAGLALPLGKGE